jgi:hypothetical protein
LNDIVFVSYNRKMRTRFQLMREKTGKKYDPLVIEEFNWDNEWADSLHVPVPSARGSDAVNDLTWHHVDEATGASQALQGRNLPRRAVVTQYSRRSRNVPAAATEDGEEEDEVEDPHDDAEVSKCEEDGNVAATEEVAADPDEFDDGF